MLSAAVVRDDAAMVRLLLSQGLPVDGRDEYGVTALMYAAHRGRRRIVTALLRAGADPNLLTEDRRSALMLAAETGQEAIALALVRAGGDRRQEDRWGRTAADYAAARGYARLARVLGGRRPVVRSAFRAAPPIRPALLEKFPAPSRDPSKGCDESWCVAVGRTERVCVGRTGSDQEARIERRAQVIARWSSPGFDPRDFEVLMADLDGDGDRELIVARHCYTGNGLGIAYWTVAILDGSGGAPLLFTVHDYGVGTFEAIEDEIIVNVTQWARGSDPVRGDGTYFQATPFRYRAGVLVPALDRAARRRRLFHVSCPECRDASVRCWLSGPFAEAAACDPLPVGHPYGGSIVRLLATDDGVVAIDVVLDGGGECGLDLSGAATDLGERIETVVDGRSGREYPPDYHPADVARWLTGRRCTLLLDQDGGGRDVLWIW
ncbi:MAG: ankyrin repeat domain-containing protein [Acidobacteriota bacterium]